MSASQSSETSADQSTDTSTGRQIVHASRLLSMHGDIAARNAHHNWRQRSALVLVLRDDRGRIGLGEAAPLPGYSPDTLSQCRMELSELVAAARPVTLDSPADIARLGQDMTTPAARCALETALLDLQGQHRQQSVAQLLAEAFGLPVRDSAPMSALLSDPLDSADPLAQVDAARARDIRCIKVKIGRRERFADELALLRQLRARHPQLTIRLDANRAWSTREAMDKLRALADLMPEYVEEPAEDLLTLLQLGAPVPVAADESLIGASDATVDAVLDSGVAALVLKPMVLGLLRSCALTARARRRGVMAVPSHLLDGPVALAAYAQFGLLTDGTCGLDRHAGLAMWPDVQSACVRTSDIVHTATPGLGLSRLDLMRQLDRA